MITDIITIFCTVAATLGGWESIKYMMNRKSNQRISKALADQEELKTTNAKFETLEKLTVFLQERLEEAHRQNAAKEDRFNDQTERLRSVQDKLDDTTEELAKKRERIASLEAERALKLCERRGCVQREPQSGY